MALAQSLVVEYYTVSETAKTNDKYPKHCDECIYPPVWTVRTQITNANNRIGYGCSEHIDEVMVRIAYLLAPGGVEDTPAP